MGHAVVYVGADSATDSPSRSRNRGHRSWSKTVGWSLHSRPHWVGSCARANEFGERRASARRWQQKSSLRSGHRMHSLGLCVLHTTGGLTPAAHSVVGSIRSESKGKGDSATAVTTVTTVTAVVA